ncbi:DNA-binding transcriptional MerR regulator [Streptosporangium becharense]|uniref:DNA-binding transcriptional MerR regulator n=1 Tax=Streptosporangium becharense TaxID=1816182 RepID=A0A7W9ME51_9ACTN|nr:MerR family transcriptional regulator [Streptosporangium becharense]MBB2915358.1 DNA-binding transcriptional MerR regulator [Streptosporangium becharense]MBB5816944.1 DNA-binding transcriptional MerR regulator [Streptosporangium becharense]
MLTIGDLARHCGTTPKAIRLYHRKGLLPEPDRAANGYRLYDATALIRLRRIRGMRDLGLPLSRIGDLLDGQAAAMHDALFELRDELDEQAALIARKRSALEQLLRDDRDPELPARLGTALATLRAAGLPAPILNRDREDLLLVITLADDPAATTEQLTTMYETLATAPNLSRYVELSRRFAALADGGHEPAELDRLARDYTGFLLTALPALGRTDAPAHGGKDFSELLGEYDESTLGPAQLAVLNAVHENLGAHLETVIPQAPS